MVALYPREKCAPFKPAEAERPGQASQRRVVLTTSPGESLVWSNTVRFVIDVGVERRKVGAAPPQQAVGESRAPVAGGRAL